MDDGTSGELTGDQMGDGNTGGDGAKLVWWILGIAAALIAAGILAVGSALFTMNGRMSSVEAKVDILIGDRAQQKGHP